jgi:hypothetical protein
MKTNDVTLSGMHLTQQKSKGGRKIAGTKQSKESSGDKVELSITRSSGLSAPSLSYDEALDLVKDMDFKLALEATKISKDSSAQLLELAQD